jgi:predicted nucleic acid-binding protein
MKPRVYIETTIPSFYHEDRTEAFVVARREWTRTWWDKRSHLYELVSSQAVRDELNEGNYAKKEKCIALLNEVPFVPTEPLIATIVHTYIQNKIMPNDAKGDALHLALASYHKCDLLLTWNCKHLANANKFNHIRFINTMMGLYIPVITTPLELLGETP